MHGESNGKYHFKLYATYSIRSNGKIGNDSFLWRAIFQMVLEEDGSWLNTYVFSWPCHSSWFSGQIMDYHKDITWQASWGNYVTHIQSGAKLMRYSLWGKTSQGHHYLQCTFPMWRYDLWCFSIWILLYFSLFGNISAVIGVL